MSQPLFNVDLFENKPTSNLLPLDGTVHYHGRIFDSEEAQRHFKTLLKSVVWKHDEAIIFGKRIVTARKVAWYGDASFSYTYSGTTKEALPWTAELRQLKAIVEKRSDANFNSCLLNLYHDGSEGMAWHSDDEKMLARHAAIGSLSFGAQRKFCFKHKRTYETASVMLESGSLLVMKGATQTHWLHSLPRSKKVMTPRINLTFRTMVG